MELRQGACCGSTKSGGDGGVISTGAVWQLKQLEQLGALLAQGDLNHWVPLLNHFDEFLEELVKARPELALTYPPAADPRPQHAGSNGSTAPADGSFPVAACVEVLRAPSVILENCSNKQLYQSYEVGGCASSRAHNTQPGSTQRDRAPAVRIIGRAWMAAAAAAR